MAVNGSAIGPRPAGRLHQPLAVEWRTLGLITANYLAWIGLITAYDVLPWPLVGILGGAVVCLHGSLQHEAIHMHPTRWPKLNYALVALPLSLWLPFEMYRRSHIAHHATEELTCPRRDPESMYVDSRCWQRLPAAARAVLRFNQTLLGRISVGPLIVVGRYWYQSLGDIAANRHGERGIWLRHVLVVTAMLLVLANVFEISAMAYVSLFALPGLALTLVRSFVEHQVARDGDHATTIVRSHCPLAFLFLYNNYHWWHHRYPRLSWYQLARKAREECDALPEGVRVYQGYGDVIKAYGLRCRDVPWWG